MRYWVLVLAAALGLSALTVGSAAAGRVSGVAVSAAMPVHTAWYGGAAVSIPSASGGQPLSLTLHMDQAGQSPPAYFWLKNVGTLTLGGLTVDLVTTAGQKQFDLALTACDSAWNRVSGACPGSSTILLTANGPGSSTCTYVQQLAPGDSHEVKVQLLSSKKNFTISSSISVTVTQSQSKIAP